MWTRADLEFVAILVPIVIFWFDMRTRREREHAENRNRLTRIETQLEPIVTWFNAVLAKQKRRQSGWDGEN